MSNIYTNQPSTTGKLVLHTNHGELGIELWCSECPKACKNFIQLSYQKYYDNTLFYKIIKDLKVEGGDPTDTGEGGQSIYGKPFADEYHSRLNFTHRGLVAMCNDDKPNNNGSRFFITLGPCQWIDKKYTIFGKVVGDTLYNLDAIAALDVDKDGRPLHPPLITSVEVTINPYIEITVPSVSDEQPLIVENEDIVENTKNNAKSINNSYLLSFDDYEGEVIQDNKIISSHDALNDPKLSKQQTEIKLTKRSTPDSDTKIEIKKDIIETNATIIPVQGQLISSKLEEIKEEKESSSSSDDDVAEENIPVDETDKTRLEYAKMKKEIIKFKKIKVGSVLDQGDVISKPLTALEIERAKYRVGKRMDKTREKETLAKLQQFKSYLHSGQFSLDTENWMNNKLKFHIDSERAYSISKAIATQNQSIQINQIEEKEIKKQIQQSLK